MKGELGMRTFNRRRVLIASASAVVGASGLLVPTVGISQSTGRNVPRTPAQTAGPFYPSPLPAETDNDLTRVAGGTGVAAGEITHLSGNLFDLRGRPIKDAQIEIWQCNAHGRYHHPRDTSSAPLDPNFQAYGRVVTDEAGGYYFKTIKPVTYPGRTPHIHFRITGADVRDFVSQMYIAGHPQNEKDGLFRSVRDGREQDTLLAIFRPVAGTKEWTAKWDIVIERTA
jgi:protocatechuate 3,4-dioxygenase, beta subunit